MDGIDTAPATAAKGSRAKGERIEARVTSEQKQLYRWAAQLEGCSFTDFVMRALEAAAADAVQKHQIIRLTVRDSDAFANALLNPGQPNERLARYAKRYEELLGD